MRLLGTKDKVLTREDLREELRDLQFSLLADLHQSLRAAEQAAPKPVVEKPQDLQNLLGNTPVEAYTNEVPKDPLSRRGPSPPSEGALRRPSLFVHLEEELTFRTRSGVKLGDVPADDQVEVEGHVQVPSSPQDELTQPLAEDSACREMSLSPEEEHGCRAIRMMVTASSFQQMAAVLILVNALLLGWEIDCHMKSASMPQIFHAADTLFCILFTAELCLRLLAFGANFFTNADWVWNIFDLIVVLPQVLHRILEMLCTLGDSMALKILPVLRLMRLVRVARLLRVLRSFEELRTIVSSIASSMGSLCWSLLVLAIVNYSFSMLLAQLVTDAQNPETLQPWFGGVARTMLTLFESSTGGVSWDIVIAPLMDEVSVWAGLAFCFYIAFSFFALLNVVTGIFVESTTRTAQFEREANIAYRISELFMKSADAETGAVTLNGFQDSLDNESMKDYFRAMGIEPMDGEALFNLLDIFHNGRLDHSEIVSGLLRLRGNAKALELALLAGEVRNLQEQLIGFQRVVRRSRN